MIANQEYLGRMLDRQQKQLSKLQSIEAVLELDPYGPLTIRGILCRIDEAEFILEELQMDEDIDHELRSQFQNVRKKTQMVFQDEEIQQQAYTELTILCDNYYREVCHFLELDPFYIELENDLGTRDAIEILLRWLEGYFDLSRHRLQVKTLDDVFRCRYEKQICEILDKHRDIERPYYPDSFWWRHPSIIAEDVECTDYDNSIWPPIDWETSRTLHIADVASPGKPYHFIAASDRGVFEDGNPGDAINAAYGVHLPDDDVSFDEIYEAPDNVELKSVEVARGKQYYARSEGDTRIMCAEEAFSGWTPADAVIQWWKDETSRPSPF